MSSVNLIVKPTPQELFSSMIGYLSQFGKTSFSDANPSISILQFERGVDPLKLEPTIGTGKIIITYNYRYKRWDCKSTLFDANIHMFDPMLFFHTILNSVQELAAAKISFLGKAEKYASRYTGEHMQFLYKLGVDLVSQGSMTYITETTDNVIAHYQNTLDSPFDVYFSVDHGESGIANRLYLGFHRDSRLHTCQVERYSIDKLKEELSDSIDFAADFFKPLIDLF